MESLSIWSLAGVVLNSAVIMAGRLSTQRVWHTFNYDVTVSNGACEAVRATSNRARMWIGNETSAYHYHSYKQTPALAL